MPIPRRKTSAIHCPFRPAATVTRLSRLSRSSTRQDNRIAAMSTTHATTLSPAAAILWAYRFADDGTAESVPVSDLDDALETRGGRFWIHAGLADTRCRIWLEHHAPLSVAARDVLLGADEHLHVNV